MESGAGGASACVGAGSGMQLAAGGGRRDRLRSRAIAAWPARLAGDDERMDSEARPSSDVRVYQAGFWHEHRRAAELRCQHALLARHPVHPAVLYAGSAAIAVS